MDVNMLIDSLASFKGEVPSEVNVFEVRRTAVDDQHNRLRKLLKTAGDACHAQFERGQWETRDDFTIVRLPQGARAEIFHASAAVKFSSGTLPMERLFKEAESKKQLGARSDELLKSLGLAEALGRNETLTFERLWQIKAAGADRQGKLSEPVLCRAVSAYRHAIEGIPVLGPASVTVHVDGAGELDAFSLLLRTPANEVRERAKTIPPERAARQIAQQLAVQFDALAGKGRSDKQAGARDFEVDCPAGLQFGYFSLPKRKVQRLLAPVYVAIFDVRHEKVRQGIVQVIAATEKSYLPLNPPGQDNPTPATNKVNGKRCCC